MLRLVTKDFRRTTLRPRHRPVVRALAEALFSPDGEASPERLDGFADEAFPIFGMPTVKKVEDLDFLGPGSPNELPASRIECLAFHPLGSAKMSTTREASVVKPTGETWDVENLFVIDGSILPTSVGVSSQLPIMGISMMLARGLVSDFDHHARRARG